MIHDERRPRGAGIRPGETERIMGRDFWPYGLEPNASGPNWHTLETFLRYSHEQGLAKRLLEPKDLFAPESLESFKI